MDFKKFNIGLKSLAAPKDNVYFKSEVTRRTLKFLRGGEAIRLVIKYEDKNLSVDGEVELRRCTVTTLEAAKK